MAAGQNAINSRSNNRGHTTISLNASANSKTSASQGLSMSASGPSQQSAQRANLTSCFATGNTAQQGRSYNPIKMMSGSSTSGWGKVKSFGNSFVSSSNCQKISQMKNASKIKMNASFGFEATPQNQAARDGVEFQIKNFPGQPIDFQKDDYFVPSA